MADDSDDIAKKSVTLAALKGGGSEAIANAAFLAALDSGLQVGAAALSHPQGTKLLTRISSIPHRFSGSRLAVWTAVGAGVGLVFGAARSAMGAVHYNHEVQKWTDRENAAENSFSPAR